MFDDDFPTRITIWLALIAYGVSVICARHLKLVWARRIWTLGCLLYLCHVVIAFDQHYQWSHELAVARTAAQTEQLTGVRTNAGIYVNYFFTLIWLMDVAYWWLAGLDRYRFRNRFIPITLHWFFVFMVFNGAIVFAHGPARWLGLAILVSLLVDWLVLRITRQDSAE